MKDMECNQCRKAHACRDGELSAAEHAAFINHMADCPACTLEMRRITRMGAFLAAGAKSAAEMPRQAQVTRWRHTRDERTKVLRFAKALTAAAALVAIVCTWGLLQYGRNEVEPNMMAANIYSNLSWERAAVTGQLEPQQNEGSEDPFVQVLFRDQP